MNAEQIISKFKEKPYLLEMGANKIAYQLKSSVEEVREAKKIIHNINKYGTEYHPSEVAFKRDRNILVVGDLHAPFTRDGYLDFCTKIHEKYNCTDVIFIGDIIDNHYSSFHATDPDGHSASQELELAKRQIAKWYKVFSEARVCIGNHDLIPIRKAFNDGLSKTWIKSIDEVLNTSNWEFAEEFMIDEVLYTHGTSRKAVNRMQYDLTSVVQGHYHSEGYINYSVGKFRKTFAMQVGCGVDDKSYAMAYGKHFNKMHISCGVVLNNGSLPILEYMDL